MLTLGKVALGKMASGVKALDDRQDTQDAYAAVYSADFSGPSEVVLDFLSLASFWLLPMCGMKPDSLKRMPETVASPRGSRAASVA